MSKRNKRYSGNFKNTIIELYNSRKILAELNVNMALQHQQ
jgi:transposase-like protein